LCNLVRVVAEDFLSRPRPGLPDQGQGLHKNLRLRPRSRTPLSRPRPRTLLSRPRPGLSRPRSRPDTYIKP